MLPRIVMSGQQDRIERLAALGQHHVWPFEGDHQLLDELFLADHFFFQYIG